MLTPGLMVRTVNPFGPYSSAYWTLSMFTAAFVSLYEGTGLRANLSAWVIEPTEVDLLE